MPAQPSPVGGAAVPDSDRVCHVRVAGGTLGRVSPQ